MANNLATTREVAPPKPQGDDDRLVQILDEYLVTLERGDPVSPEDLVARHPDVADRLRGYLSGLKLFHDAIGAPQPALATVDRGKLGVELRGVLGDFRLVREIGRGGMGVVYEAVQVSLGRKVAVKILPFTAAIDEKQIMRFKNEAQAAAQVDHPNIVPVFAIGQEQGIHYFAMQLISGRSLSRVLEELLGNADGEANVPIAYRETVPISTTASHVRAVARMGVQAAEALHAAHEIGVVHRDVKPSNLLLDDKGKVWVTDFGVARCITSASLTSTGHALGTIRYMSPEQAQGEAALVDHRTDVYSLGVTLYELACLRHPFQGVADAALAFEFGRCGMRRPTYWNKSIPTDFENIILKALADERERRYSTAREMAEDLQRFLQGRPIQARRPSLTLRLAKWSRLHKRSVAAGAGVLAAAMLGAIISLVTIASERNEKVLAYQTAKANHERAERSFEQAQASLDQARQMLDRVGSRIAERLASVPGGEGVRKELLWEMLPYYQQFAREAADNSAASADLALTHAKIGFLSEQLGLQGDAEEAYRQAQVIFKRLSQAGSEAQEHLRNLALCSNNLGQLLRKRGEVRGAKVELERALAVQQQLVDAAPQSHAYAVDLATTQSNLGLLLSEMGSKTAAAEHYMDAIRLHEKIVQAAPEDRENRSHLAASYNNLSSLFMESDPKLARGWIEKAMSLQLDLVQAHPREREYQVDLALSYNNLGAIYSRQSNWEEALTCFGDAITIQKRLATTAPLVAAYRRDLAVSYNNLGMTQSKAGSLDEAEGSFQEALKLQHALVDSSPSEANLLSALGGIYNNLAKVHEGRGELEKASATYEVAIAVQRRAYDQTPEAPAVRDSLSKHYSNHALVLRKLGRPLDAARATLERRALCGNDPARIYRVAEELALSCQVMESGEQRKHYSDQALDLLREAMEAGLTAVPDLKASPLDVLTGSFKAVKQRGEQPAAQAAIPMSNQPTVQ